MLQSGLSARNSIAILASPHRKDQRRTVPHGKRRQTGMIVSDAPILKH